MDCSTTVARSRAEESFSNGWTNECLTGHLLLLMTALTL
uniref:Uncharacterized protein n=1 Tax=Arundo donax TaxID=35708 RepID=A0A0A9A5A7_ARUDO